MVPQPPARTPGSCRGPLWAAAQPVTRKCRPPGAPREMLGGARLGGSGALQAVAELVGGDRRLSAVQLGVAAGLCGRNVLVAAG